MRDNWGLPWREARIDPWTGPHRKAWYKALAGVPTRQDGDESAVAVRIARTVGREFGVGVKRILVPRGKRHNDIERLAFLACIYVARTAFGMRIEDQLPKAFGYISPERCRSYCRRALDARKAEPCFREVTDDLVRQWET